MPIGSQFVGQAFPGVGIPQFAQQGGGFSGLLGLTSPNFSFGGGGLQQGFLGRAFGQGFGSLFGDKKGIVDLGGGNFFKSGQGFTQRAQGAPFKGQMPMASGFNFGNFLGSLFG